MALVSVNAEDLAHVIGLACLTESRTNDEQRSLLAVAERLDKKRNAKVTMNMYPAKGAMWAWLPEDQRVGDDADNWVYRILPESRTELEAHQSRGTLEPVMKERYIKPSWERKATKGR